MEFFLSYEQNLWDVFYQIIPRAVFSLYIYKKVDNIIALPQISLTI